MRKTPERNFKKKTCIFTWNFTLGQFSVSACANQTHGFSVSGTLTPNRIFQIIRLVGYSK